MPVHYCLFLFLVSCAGLLMKWCSVLFLAGLLMVRVAIAWSGRALLAGSSLFSLFICLISLYFVPSFSSFRFLHLKLLFSCGWPMFMLRGLAGWSGCVARTGVCILVSFLFHYFLLFLFCLPRLSVGSLTLLFVVARFFLTGVCVGFIALIWLRVLSALESLAGVQLVSPIGFDL
jgi:hypothetical protein